MRARPPKRPASTKEPLQTGQKSRLQRTGWDRPPATGRTHSRLGRARPLLRPHGRPLLRHATQTRRTRTHCTPHTHGCTGDTGYSTRMHTTHRLEGHTRMHGTYWLLDTQTTGAPSRRLDVPFYQGRHRGDAAAPSRWAPEFEKLQNCYSVVLTRAHRLDGLLVPLKPRQVLLVEPPACQPTK